MGNKFPPRRNTALNEVSIAKVNKTRHSGPLGKAKMLTPDQFDRAAAKAADRGQFGQRDKLFIQLSRFAGLRSAEIARMHVEDITDVEGKFIEGINISKRGAKYGKERTVRLRPEVLKELQEYVQAAGITKGPIFWTQRGDPMTPNAVQKQIKAAYLACGFQGARSHSGRRYAITTLARNVNTIGASLEDVRIFAGHSNISTTGRYIDESPHAAKMMQFL